MGCLRLMMASSPSLVTSLVHEMQSSFLQHQISKEFSFRLSVSFKVQLPVPNSCRASIVHVRVLRRILATQAARLCAAIQHPQAQHVHVLRTCVRTYTQLSAAGALDQYNIRMYMYSTRTIHVRAHVQERQTANGVSLSSRR